MPPGTHIWLDRTFEVFPVFSSLDGTWVDKGGVYLFAGYNQSGQFCPFYVGQTASLADRLPNHPRWPAAARLGATQVHARLEPVAFDRTRLEREIYDAYRRFLLNDKRP